jgi:hypothetical protein
MNDLALDSRTDRLDLEVPQYRAVIKFSRRGKLDHESIARGLEGLVARIGMKLAVPGIVTGWCEKGLGGWAHITTSCISLMEYWTGGDEILVTVEMYSCREYDPADAAAFLAGHFGIDPREMRVYRAELVLIS